MPKKSKATIALEAIEATLVAGLMMIVESPTTSVSARTRAIGTLRGISKERKRELAKSQAGIKAKRAARTAAKAEAAHKTMLAAVLPDNGRLYKPGEAGYVASARPAAPPVAANNPYLPQPGESPAQTRARLERMAEAE